LGLAPCSEAGALPSPSLAAWDGDAAGGNGTGGGGAPALPLLPPRGGRPAAAPSP
jgi:hypothetical protein